MKKGLVIVLSVILLTFTFSGCDATIRENIADFMDSLSGNVYLENGIVEPNTADAEAVVDAITSIGTGAAQETVTDGSTGVLGISVTVSATTTLKPQDPDEQEDLKDSLLKSLETKSNRDLLTKELEADAEDDQIEAAKGSVEVLNETLEELESDLATNNPELSQALSQLTLPVIDEDDELSKGDVLLLQMMTNLLKNTFEVLDEASSGDLGTLDSDDLTDDAIQQDIDRLVEDALLIARLAEELSGAAGIDFSGQLNFDTLIQSFNRSARASRQTSGEIGQEAADLLNSKMEDVIELMGITREGDTYTYTKDSYQSFLSNQVIYRGSIEYAITMATQSNISLKDVENVTIDTSTL
ncbi:MAG: hypothetical protein EOM15_16110, partial [Spirochaetia bacterium]|nr:hypothetical protein [Spirochaetia bacterium]